MVEYLTCNDEEAIGGQGSAQASADAIHHSRDFFKEGSHVLALLKRITNEEKAIRKEAEGKSNPEVGQATNRTEEVVVEVGGEQESSNLKDVLLAQSNSVDSSSRSCASSSSASSSSSNTTSIKCNL